MISRSAKIGSSSGLHARPAARFASAVDDSGLDVVMKFGDSEADASSALEIMTLGVKNGDNVIIETEDDNPQAEEIMDKLAALLATDLDAEE